MIEVEHITKSFGAIQAVSDVSFTVERGEILGFLGPNGAGKTTTMRMLTGFFPPSTGSIKVAGLSVFSNSLEVRRKIGYLPENVPLYGEMAVKDYLGFVAEVKGIGRRERKKAVDQVVDSCGLEPVRKRLVSNVSKGFRQRVGLAQALLGDPEVLILDEPTIGLDPKQIVDIRQLIRDFAEKKTVILSTHILPEVSMICKRVVIINEGRVVAEGSPESLSATLSGTSRVLLSVAGPAADIKKKLMEVSGVKKVKAGDFEGSFSVEFADDKNLPPKLAEMVISSGWDLFEMTPQTANLEDVFINLVTKE